MSSLNFWEMQAREKAGAPESWQMISWEQLPKRNDPAQVYRITGAIPTGVIKRGPRKGDPSFRGAVRTEVYITPAEHDAYLAAWEERTGLCRYCEGSGQAWCGWNHLTGNRFRPCEICSATGKRAAS